AKRIFFLIGSFLPIFIAILWRNHLFERLFPKKYIAVIDAGSSGSRLVVYRSAGSGNLIQLGLYTVEPGLNSFGSDAKGAWNTLHSILEKAEKELSLPNVIPVYLYATGGFRKLSEDKRTTLANQVCQLSSNSSSIMRLELDRWMVLSGSDEAYYGWLAVNYLEGCIDGNGKRVKRTVGAMDWGGESLEMAFEEEHVYTHSFSEIGANGVLTLILTHLLQSSSNHTYVRNPCFPLGYSEERDGVLYVGTGELNRCESVVSTLFRCGERESDICHLQQLSIAQSNQSFFGMSLLFYVADFLYFVENKVTGRGTGSAEYQYFDELSFRNRLQLLLFLSWNDLQSKIGSAHRYTSMSLLPYRALQGVFLKYLVSTMIGTEKNTIIFVKTVNHHNVDWSLGAALALLQFSVF
ncbi:hypothetical protein WA171_005586, partial [Blastocystis sp. BT1]